MNYPNIEDILLLQQRLIETSSGTHGLHDRGLLESAIAQMQMSFDGQELYSTLPEKAAALGFSLTRNHAFIDGNKRIGHAAMELLLRMNSYNLTADVDEQERVMLALAASQMGREEFVAWVQQHIRTR